MCTRACPRRVARFNSGLGKHPHLRQATPRPAACKKNGQSAKEDVRLLQICDVLELRPVPQELPRVCLGRANQQPSCVSFLQCGLVTRHTVRAAGSGTLSIPSPAVLKTRITKSYPILSRNVGSPSAEHCLLVSGGGTFGARKMARARKAADRVSREHLQLHKSLALR